MALWFLGVTSLPLLVAGRVIGRPPLRGADDKRLGIARQAWLLFSTISQVSLTRSTSARVWSPAASLDPAILLDNQNKPLALLNAEGPYALYFQLGLRPRRVHGGRTGWHGGEPQEAGHNGDARTKDDFRRSAGLQGSPSSRNRTAPSRACRTWHDEGGGLDPIPR